MIQRANTKTVEYYESLYRQFGDTFRGVGWTKSQEDTDKRYQVMTEVFDKDSRRSISVLDLGCGLSHLYEYILKNGDVHVNYSGVDICEAYLEASREKFPTSKYYNMDILEDDTPLPIFDYIVMNGVFTVNIGRSHQEMKKYLQNMLMVLYNHVRYATAFNVMSKLVDWERDDLFHLGFDELTELLAESVGRSFVIRHDYGLFEYTVYVYR